jgi:hypothetical protein
LLRRYRAGIPGDVNRAQQHTVETQVITPSGSAGAPLSYGIPVVLDPTSHQIRSVAAADLVGGPSPGTGPCYGILVRPFPAQSSQDAIGVSTPPGSGPCDVLRRGYISVKLTGATAAVKGAPVYVFAAASAGANVLGGINAGSTTAYPIGAVFMGPADANGITEIAFNI